ncbi:MAG: DUF2905 domain-containing protein [Spirochaetes bacterium]|nr:DUF2905 domain-containing protein [Spirochaetota bacterium]
MSGNIGKTLIIIGCVILLFGILLYFKNNISVVKYIGKLPGDIKIERENFTFYFPLGTSILLSIILSAVFIIINKLR